MRLSDINVGDRLLINTGSLRKPRHWPHLEAIVENSDIDPDKECGFLNLDRGGPGPKGDMASWFRWAFGVKPWDQLVASSAAVWLTDIEITEVGLPWKAKMDGIRGTVTLSVRQQHLCQSHSFEDCRIFCNPSEPPLPGEDASEEERRAWIEEIQEWDDNQLFCGPGSCNHGDHHVVEERDVVVHFSTLIHPAIHAAESIAAKAAYVPNRIQLMKRNLEGGRGNQ